MTPPESCSTDCHAAAGSHQGQVAALRHVGSRPQNGQWIVNRRSVGPLLLSSAEARADGRAWRSAGTPGHRRVSLADRWLWLFLALVNPAAESMRPRHVLRCVRHAVPHDAPQFVRSIMKERHVGRVTTTHDIDDTAAGAQRTAVTPRFLPANCPKGRPVLCELNRSNVNSEMAS